MDAESAVAIPDPASTTDPQALKLNTDTAPSDFDPGDHVYLTADAYTAIASLFDLSGLANPAS
ncbi:hypothetical protein [Streptomyces sp. NPDC007206]|uniref:hypothetical protein n=1 Tax=Streptomyces sp. NPDC007206 TaxID=3154317 RepID=UPI0034074B1D